MIRHILSTFFTRFFIAISNLAIAIILSNFTGAYGRGEQSLIITFISFIIIISGIIGSSSISYLLPRLNFSSLIVPSYLWVVVVTALCFFILPVLNQVDASYTVDICFLSLIFSFININTSVLISKQRIYEANMIGFVQALMTVIWLLFAFIVLNNRTVNTYINALYVGYCSALLMSFSYTAPYFKAMKLQPVQDYLKASKMLSVFGFYNQVAVFTQMLSFRLSYYLLNSWIGTEEVGVYSNAVSIAESVWLIARSIGTVQHSRIVNSKDRGSSLKLTSRVNKLNIFISIFLLTVLSLIPSAWYIFIFGKDFNGINHIVWTLAPGILFFGIAIILGYYFSSTGKHFVNAIGSSAGLIVTVILGLILIPRYGVAGAGITASISYAITALIVWLYYRRELINVKPL